MTYKDILTKYMIEYDKANVTSSYPSLTKYEIATILDKAYLAILAQKLTGNQQRVPFEGDPKAVEDVRPLIDTKQISKSDEQPLGVKNGAVYKIGDILYFITAKVSIDDDMVTTDLVPHEVAKKFMHTTSNRPWIKNTVCYIEGDNVIVLYDDYYDHMLSDLYLTYMKKPKKFVDNIDANTEFELSDTMAEELINLAIIMSLETVESPRLQTKLNTKSLEA